MLFKTVIPAGDAVNYCLVVPYFGFALNILGQLDQRPNCRWICFYILATVVSIVVLGQKILIFIEQLRERRNKLASLEDEETNISKKIRMHRTRLLHTARSIKMICGSIMVACAEQIPIGILQGTLVCTCKTELFMDAAIVRLLCSCVRASLSETGSHVAAVAHHIMVCPCGCTVRP